MMVGRVTISIGLDSKLRRLNFTEPRTIACMKWRYISSYWKDGIVAVARDGIPKYDY
jgi:hypothetical protein